MLNVIYSATAQRKLLVRLAWRDLTNVYSGSVFGNLWVVVEPLINVLLTVLFFQFAIKASDNGGVSYIAWVLPVLIFWTFVNTVLSSGVSSIREYGYLIRHINFDMHNVALIKIIAASIIHIPLMIILYGICLIFFNIHPTWKNLNLVYYFFSMCSLLISMVWLLSAVAVFWKDIRNLLSIFLQVEFWLSPIFWEPNRFPKLIALFMYLNPFYYPLHGYRQAILGVEFGDYFFLLSLYFWCITAASLYFSSKIFSRLTKQFGDVI